MSLFKSYLLLRSSFFFDLLTVIPFRFFFNVNLHQDTGSSMYLQLLHLLKLFRLQKIFQLLEPRQFNNLIKEYYSNKLKRKLAQMKEEGKTFSADSKVDHNYIMR